MPKGSPNGKILRIGHRGACGHAPENTLASIKRAITLRCSLTEVDIRRTADDELILVHDERIHSTPHGRGLVSEMTLEEIRKLDVGGGQMVPTLEEVLGTSNGRIGLILELKTKGLAYDICAIVRASGFVRPVIYASFVHEELQHIRRIDPEAKTLVLFKRLPNDPGAAALRLQATHVGLRVDMVTKSLVTALHHARLIVFVYTANKPAEIKKMKALGVNGLISDFPDRI